MKRKYKVWLVVLVLLIICLSIICLYRIFNPVEDREKIQVNVLDTISEYDYKIDDRDSSYYKSEFEKLKNILNEEIDYKVYSEQIAKMFIIDLYSIGTKVNKYDVGGLEFYHSNKKGMHELKVRDTLYDLLEDDSYGDRNQELPIVKSVEIISSLEDVYKLGDEEVPAYKIILKWDYEKDLGYDKEATIYVVKDGIKQSVVSFNPVIESEE